MRAFLHFITRSVSAIFGTGITWLIALIPFEQGLLMSSVYALLGGGFTFFSVKELQNFQIVRRNGLSRREYKFVNQNLKEAKEKINRLQRALLRVRSISHAKENYEILQTVRKIYSNTKKEPKRFFQAERFYYKNLDSLVELVEKYAFLSSQPAKTNEMNDSLKDTRQTIKALGNSVKKDLHVMLDDDMDTLHFELDVAKQSFKKIEKMTGRCSK